ncbi:unhealthy ribosome biogenesis protein 2 homolog, partial [Saccoglossus kowalevskii]|uniref:Unhealthy ribosome biogenesis protein 2 homolog n=1 Tax=Saccoglossus kowalevskii TaxID=10224 RepID=A0ABM0MUI0_SACKO
VYIDYLRREDADICLEHVISCCQATLSSHNLMLIFTAKYEVFVQFFSSLLSLSSNILSNDGTLSVAMEILLTSSLERYSTLQRQQINQRMVFVSVYEHLFIAGMSLHHQLCKKQHNMDTEKTRQIIENIIISGIFHR